MHTYQHEVRVAREAGYMDAFKTEAFMLRFIVGIPASLSWSSARAWPIRFDEICGNR